MSFGKKLSFFAEGQQNYKEGNYISNITSNYNGSKINTEGTFGYNPIRFGGGIRIPFTKIDSPQDAYLELSYFRELLGTFTSNIDQQSNPGLSSYPADKADIFKLNILLVAEYLLKVNILLNILPLEMLILKYRSQLKFLVIIIRLKALMFNL